MRKLLMTTLFLLALMLTGCKDDEEFTITPAPVPQEKEEIPEFSWEFDNNYKVPGRITKEALYGKWKLVGFEYDEKEVDYIKIIDFHTNDTVYITSLKDGKFEQIKEPFDYRFYRDWKVETREGNNYYKYHENYPFCLNYDSYYNIAAIGSYIIFRYEIPYLLTWAPLPAPIYRRLTDNSLSTLSLEDYKAPEKKVGTPVSSDIKWEYDEDFENYEEDGQIRVIEGKWKLVNVGGIPVDYLEILDFDEYTVEMFSQENGNKEKIIFAYFDYCYGEWFDVQESGEPSEFPKIGNRVMIRNFGEFTVKKGNQKNEIILEDPNSQEQNYRTYRRLK